MAEKSKKNRKTFIDILRVFATAAVILLHTVNGVKDHTDMTLYPQEFRIFLGILDVVTWCVPVFVIISGYLFLNPYRQFSWRQMLAKYCRRIVLALILFGIPYACIELVLTQRQFRVSMLAEAVVLVLQGKSWSHMWYLYLVLLLYLITIPLKWFLKRLPMAVVYIVMGILVMGSSIFLYINKCGENSLLPVLPDTCIYVFYYLFGYVMAVRESKEKEKAGLPVWACPTGIALLAVGMICNRMLTGHQIQMAYDYPFTVLLVLLLFAWAQKCDWKLTGKISIYMDKLSELSFTVYLIHPIYLNIIYKLIKVNPLSYPLWLSLPLVWLTVALCSIGTAWALRKIPILRRYVL